MSDRLPDPMHDPKISVSAMGLPCPCGCGIVRPDCDVVPSIRPDTMWMLPEPSSPSTPPREVSHDDLMAALEPLMQLLGTDAKRIYDGPGLRIEDGFITVTFSGPIVTEAAARNVTVGEGDFAEAATEARIKVRR